ncbi:MAG: hypothetical protein M3450_06560 [Actinomycetota bacterium]|nr:hypothetical protein [Actinomycetota bacterium]
MIEGREWRTILAIGAVALGLTACGGSEEPNGPAAADPKEAIGSAGERAMASRSTFLNVRAQSGDTSWEAEGAVQLGQGRFVLDVLGIESSKRNIGPDRVIGLDGEGFETTVEETMGLFGDDRDAKERCWFNPHAPVGSFLGTASIEESVRLTGALIESLETETSSVIERDGHFQVEYMPSAAKPHSDFRETERRVWGDRALIEDLEGPVSLMLDDASELSHINIDLGEYRQYSGLGGRKRLDEVSIRATLSSSDERPQIDPPDCQALE